jgi:PKD domain
MKKLSRLLFTFSLAPVALLIIGQLSFAWAAQNVANPQLAFLFPTGEVVTNRVLILVDQQNPEFDPRTVRKVAFEFSRVPAVKWKQISVVSGVEMDTESFDLNRWRSLWDTETLGPGRYLLRVTVSFRSGSRLKSQSQTKRIIVNRAPVVNSVVTQPGEARGEVQFDGSNVSDRDGSVKEWAWDFGDPVANKNARFLNNGRRAITRFEDLAKTYSVRLTITDNREFQTSGYYLFGFPVLKRRLKQNNNCVCKSIKVRTKGNALGPDGKDDADGWPKTPGMDDGKKLGPLDGNPDNGITGGEKDNTGFAFEIVAEVEGNPDKCKETQLIKRTITRAGGAAANKTYKGTGDRDLDGTNDMNVTDEASCKAAGGSWNATTTMCEFPQSGKKYQPDGKAGGSIYDKEYPGKKHQGNLILWYDTPYLGNTYGNGSTYKADFIAIVRGTDGKYCYVMFSIKLERKAGKDSEEISPAPNAAGDIEGMNDKASVPDVP